MTGVRLPIVKDGSRLHSRLRRSITFIQDNSLAPGAYDIVVHESGDVDFVTNSIRHAQDKVNHRAPHHAALLHAVYEWLRTQGCEWYWPGRYGEIVPRKDRLTISSTSHRPYFTYFSYQGGPVDIDRDSPDKAFYNSLDRHRSGDYQWYWTIRQGGINALGITYDHAWNHIMGYERTTWSDGSYYEKSCADWPREYYAWRDSGPQGTHLDFYGLSDYDPSDVTHRLCSKVPPVVQPQYCTSKPGVFNAFMHYLDLRCQKEPQETVLSISPNDGSGGFCRCLECRKHDGAIDRSTLYGDLNGDGAVDEDDVRAWKTLPAKIQSRVDLDSFTRTGPKEYDDWRIQYREDPVYSAPGYMRLTDRILGFYVDLAKAFEKTNPDRKLCGLIYGLYANQPYRDWSPKPDNLILSLSLNDAPYADRARREYYEKLIDYWAQYAQGNIHFYTIAHRDSIGLARPLGQHYYDLLRRIYERDFLGTYVYVSASNEEFGITSYLTGRLHWDPHADTDSLTDRYFNDLYSRMGEPISSYYGLLSERGNHARDFLPSESWGGDFDGVPLEYKYDYYTHYPIMDRLEAIAEEVMNYSTYEDDMNLRKRYERFLNMWRVTKATINALYWRRRALSEQPVTDSTWQSYDNALRARDHAINQIESDGTYGENIVSRIRATENRFLSSWLSTESGLAEVPVPHCDTTRIYHSDLNEIDSEGPFAMSGWGEHYPAPSIESEVGQNGDASATYMRLPLPDEPSFARSLSIRGFDEIVNRDGDPGRKWISASIRVRNTGHVVPATNNQGDIRVMGNGEILEVYPRRDCNGKWMTVDCFFPVRKADNHVTIRAFGGGVFDIDDIEIRLFTLKR